MRELPLLPLPLVADGERVRAALGGPSSIPASMEPRFLELLRLTQQICKPKGRLVLANIISCNEGIVTLEGGIVFRGAGIFGLLRSCEAVAAFLVTLGSEAEQQTQRAVSEGRMADATLLNAIASELVEHQAALAQARVEEIMSAEDRGTTRRFSPGYCDWEVEAQSQLDRLIGFERVGVSLTSGMMMVPEKTISAIMGVGAVHSLQQSLAQSPACGACAKVSTCPRSSSP